MTTTVHLAWTRQVDPSDRDAVARAAVGAALSIEPASVEIGRRCGRCGSRRHGVPLALVEGRAGLATVSLSRGGGAAVAAAAVGGTSVGVDIEWADTRTHDLSAVALAHGEQVPVGPHGLLRLWTRKEAVLKAAGIGLDADPRDLLLDELAVEAGPAGPWWLADADLAPGLIGCVAVRAGAAHIAGIARLDR